MRQSKGGKLTKRFGQRLIMALSLCGLLCTSPVWADTVYRCGDTYSTSAQCAQTRAHELPQHEGPLSASTTSTGQDNLAREQRDALTLEKMRVQSEQQTMLAAPLPAQRAPHNFVSKPRERAQERASHHGRHRYQSPYFTAKAPSPPKEKAAPSVKSAASSATQ